MPGYTPPEERNFPIRHPEPSKRQIIDVDVTFSEAFRWAANVILAWFLAALILAAIISFLTGVVMFAIAKK